MAEAGGRRRPGLPAPGRPTARECPGVAVPRPGREHRARRPGPRPPAHVPLDGPPLICRPPGEPPALTYPAGPGLPPAPSGLPPAPSGPADGLAAVLGRTRLDALLVLADEHSTTGLARRLGVSNATASSHAAALRGAGLITTARAGRAVVHRRTALGTLLVRRSGSSPPRPRPDSGLRGESRQPSRASA
ncbi:winged helix-turn-helix domain-containing protein [Streptomyces thioluteus]|uniref:ArsR/SmtB family transcription factor n=1 Tax=Streptomyces thioluteus TaxID=66431 RepID=UPI0031E8D73E